MNKSNDDQRQDIQNTNSPFEVICNFLSAFKPESLTSNNTDDHKWDDFINATDCFLSMKRSHFLDLIYKFLSIIKPENLTGIDPADGQNMLEVVLSKWKVGENEQEQDITRLEALKWAAEVEALTYPESNFFRNIHIGMKEYIQHTVEM